MSISGLDRTARFTTSAVYNIPDPIKNEGSFFGHFLDGWGTAAALTAQTGGPIGFDSQCSHDHYERYQAAGNSHREPRPWENS